MQYGLNCTITEAIKLLQWFLVWHSVNCIQLYELYLSLLTTHPLCDEMLADIERGLDGIPIDLYCLEIVMCSSGRVLVVKSHVLQGELKNLICRLSSDQVPSQSQSVPLTSIVSWKCFSL